MNAYITNMISFTVSSFVWLVFVVAIAQLISELISKLISKFYLVKISCNIFYVFGIILYGTIFGLMKLWNFIYLQIDELNKEILELKKENDVLKIQDNIHKTQLYFSEEELNKLFYYVNKIENIDNCYDIVKQAFSVKTI
jgi:hypothetical protein